MNGPLTTIYVLSDENDCIKKKKARKQMAFLVTLISRVHSGIKRGGIQSLCCSSTDPEIARFPSGEAVMEHRDNREREHRRPSLCLYNTCHFRDGNAYH